MENQTYTHIQNLTPITIHTSNSDIPVANSNSSMLSLTSSLETLQAVPVTQSIEIYSGNTPTESTLVLNQPIFDKLIGETIKQEKFENNTIQTEYSLQKPKLIQNQFDPNNILQPTPINPIHSNSRDLTNGLSTRSIPMANIGSHLVSTLNPSHLSDVAGPYFVTGLNNDLSSNYKMPSSSNSDLPSPSTSSNSSNPSSSNHHHHHHQTHLNSKRYGESVDPNGKREIRLQKNRDAARECRRKKKEYIKCLEERVAGLENQNKALIEELRQLKELYCQRGETNNNSNNKTSSTT